MLRTCKRTFSANPVELKRTLRFNARTRFNIEPATNNLLLFHEYSNIQSMGKRLFFPPNSWKIIIFFYCLFANVFKSKRYVISGDDNLRKQSTFRDATAVFPAKWRLRNERRIPFWRCVITQVMGSASDWLEICFYQSETLPRFGKWCVSATRHQYRSMDFLRSFLRCQLAGKPVVSWRNVGCCCCCFFFFSLFNVKNNFDTQLEYVDLRDSVKQARDTRQKKWIWNERTPTVFPFPLVK